MNIKEYMEEQLDYVCPGQREPVMAYFSKEQCLLNSEEMLGENVVENAYSMLIHRAIECDNFENGSWTKDVSYGTLEDIRKQGHDNYYIDYEIMNFLFSLKVALNEMIQKGTRYLICYDFESETYSVSQDNEIEEEIKQYEETRDE